MGTVSSLSNELSISGAGTRLPYETPRLSVLGDVCSLTETGSMMSNESPWNWCILDINMVGNACMG